MPEKAVLENYEINPYTMMIGPGANENEAIVVETDSRLTVSCRPFDIVKRSCEYFGSSYGGRKEGTKQLIGITHKAPIIIDPYTSIFLFPTASPASPQCIWLSHDFIATYKKKQAYSTIVTFQNNESYEIPISSSSFENQLSRTAMLRVKFTQNMKRMEGFGRQAMRQIHRASEPTGAYWVSD